MTQPRRKTRKSHWQIIEGDCFEALRAMRGEMVDSVITDPPAGIAFMGANWDHDKGGRAVWIAWLTDVMRECLRVLKPGGHMLVWGLPRTSHWTAMAIEDAGFELRDCICHVFGSGFPKSLDVSKALDKAAGAKRKPVGSYQRPDGTERNYRDWQPKEGTPAFGDYGIDRCVTAPATAAAKQWEGFGTALKPAVEFWHLARKPLGSTVAACVQAHGTGGLNIDGCRVPTSEDRSHPPRGVSNVFEDRSLKPSGYESHPGGRWPPNLLLSHDHAEGQACAAECPVARLDGQAGPLKSGSRAAGVRKGIGYESSARGDGGPAIVGNVGGASRFFPVFYCPKASKSDRGEGNAHPTVKSTKLMAWLCRLVTPPGGLVLDPFAGSGSTLVAAVRGGFRCLGVEQSAEFCAMARRRLAAR